MRPVSVGFSLAAGATTTVYTVPTGYYALFSMMYIHNSNLTKHITVQWYKASTSTTVDILTEVDYAAKDYTQFSGAYIVLEEGDQIKATTQSSSQFSFIGTFDLYGAQRT